MSEIDINIASRPHSNAYCFYLPISFPFSFFSSPFPFHLLQRIVGNRQKKIRRISFIKKNQISFLRRGIAIAWKREEEIFFGFNHIFLQECLMWKSTFAPFTFRALPCNRDYLRDWKLVHVVDEILTGPLQDCTGPYPRRMYINQSILMLELQPSLLGQIKTKSISLRQTLDLGYLFGWRFPPPKCIPHSIVY